MPSEVTRFVMSRSPQRAGAEGGGLPALRTEDWIKDSEFEQRLTGAEQPHVRRRIAQGLLSQVVPDPFTDLADIAVPMAGKVAALDDWLTRHGNQPDPATLRKQVTKLFDRDPPDADRDCKDGDSRHDDDDAGDTHRRLTEGPSGFPADDPLRSTARQFAELLIAAGHDDVSAPAQRSLYRAVLVLGLVELLLTAPRTVRRAADVLKALRDRVVLLPRKFFPLPLRSALARKPGWADLYVVREEWNRYVPGGIAHIENAMAGEFRERVHTRIDESETTLTTSLERSRLEERDVQSATRFELTEDSRSDTSLAAHVEGQVDTSGQYGPTKVDTHLGGSLDYSVEESLGQALQQSSEIIARAVNRVEERTREERITRALTRIEDKNTHRIDKTGEAAGVGMYRWVDKIVRLQTFRYRHRFLLEFQVPEPGAYLRWLDGRNDDEGFRTPAPTPFTLDGAAETNGNPALLATDISDKPESPGYYLRLAARWHTTGITAPPPAETVANGWLHVPAGDPAQDKTSHEVWITPLDGSAAGSGRAGGVEGQSVKVPDGYVAADTWNGWVSTWDCDDSIKPAWNTSQAETWSYVPPAAFVTVGDSLNDVNDSSNAMIAAGTRSAVSKRIGGSLDGRRTGILPITVLVANYGLMSVQVRVRCIREDKGALLTWQLATYERLRASYFELLRAHEEERAARSVQAGVEIEGRSPLENSRMVREELKRQVIELLIGSRFSGFDYIESGDQGRPQNKIAESAAGASLIQFLEQVFEWENLTYVMYPYFWGASGRWDRLQPIQSPDPDYARFLRAGSARVVLSARPGFSCAVLYFMATGKPWHGQRSPVPEDPEYVSIAREIQAQTGAPDDGEAIGDSWEVRLPTTLVWLDPAPSLPKKNSEAELPEPPKKK